MNICEMLRLASKVAGIEVRPDGPHAGVSEADGIWHDGFWPDDSIYRTSWRPHLDDGEALRLAVALQAAKGSSWVICLSIGDNRTACEFNYACGPDPAANTRLAILTAAAEHGKTLP